MILFTITITGIQKANQDKTIQSQDNIDGEWKWLNGLAGYGFEKSSFGIRVRD